MGKCRVKALTDFTIIHNSLFRDNTLSYKAKGILCHILSLPDDWDYTISGLVRTGYTKEGEDAIKSGIRELEEAGYVLRERRRNPDGTLGGMEYTFSGFPEFRKNDTPSADDGRLAGGGSEAPLFDNSKNTINNDFLPTGENLLQAPAAEFFVKKAELSPAPAKAAADEPTATLPTGEKPTGENPLQVLSNTSILESNLQSKELLRKEKEINKEKEKDGLTDASTPPCEKEKEREIFNSALEAKKTTPELISFVKKKIDYEKLLASSTLQEAYATQSALKKAADMCVTIISNAVLSAETKVDGVTYGRECIVTQFFPHISFSYVHGFLMHLSSFRDLPSITTPARYWSSAFFNFCFELRMISKQEVRPDASDAGSASRHGSTSRDNLSHRQRTTSARGNFTQRDYSEEFYQNLVSFSRDNLSQDS